MELLAPAGDRAALRAAVCAGADAVYLGYTSFGARAAAANFDAEALQEAVAYAHLYRVRVYVTVNTLVKPGETEAVLDALSAIAACRADAVIVQDPGVLRLAREHFPALALHASTQMGIHTASGARFALEHGVRRIVLARECPLPVIAEVAETGAEAEVFVHGALCASVSGQCLFSSMAGGRSGNRGRCAQPCRQTVTLEGDTGALLSLRDLCLRDCLPELQKAGVAALKIEGRLKRPEYVAVVTSAYRKALDALARGAFLPADEKEKTALRQVFHRGGFTEGHAMGAEDAALCEVERVNHGGVSVGTITALHGGLAVAELVKTLHDGDSLRIEGEEDVEIRYSGPEQPNRATLWLRPGVRVHKGDPLVRLADAMQIARAQSLAEPDIPITIRAVVRTGEPLRLAVSDGASAAEVVGETAQTPRTRAMEREEIIRSLVRLGDTPFTLAAEPELETNGAFTPVSALNALRRSALEKLASVRREAFAAGNGKQTPHPPAPAALNPQEDCKLSPASVRKPAWNITKTLAVRFRQASAGQEFLSAGANLLLYAPQDWRTEVLAAELPQLPEGTWLSLPPQMSDAAFSAVRPLITACGGRLAGVVLGSVGQLGFPIPLPVALGGGVPVTNREAARELLIEDVAFFTLWPELNYGEMKALLPDTRSVPALLTVYGRERVMLLNHCPARVARGLTVGRADCALCRAGDRACAAPDPIMTDRKGYRFPVGRVRLPEGCVLELYNALPTDLAAQENRRGALGAGMLLNFTVETHSQQLAVTRRFAALMRTGAAPESDVPSTAGHFLRGVE